MAEADDAKKDSKEPPPVQPGNPVIDPVSSQGVIFLGLLFLALAVVIFYALVASWPVQTEKAFEDFYLFGMGPIKMSSDSRLFLMVICAGALGSLLHTLTSFADYVGNRQLSKSWVWWFIMRPPMGVALALLFYLVLRGGLIVPNLQSGQTPPQVLNPYGFAALAALAGMFSKQATDKLREIFETVFTPQKPVNRSDPLTSATKPSIATTVPDKLAINTNQLALTVNGTGFQKDSKATVNGKPRTADWVSDKQIKLTLLPEDVAAKGKLQVVVQNSASAGGNSEPFGVSVE